MKYLSLPFCLAPLFLSSLANASQPYSDTLTGDWGGERSRIKDSGLSLDAEYTNVYQSAVSGSPSNSNEFTHRFDLLTGLDTENAGLWKNGTFRTQLIYLNGDANDFGFSSLSVPNSAHYSDSSSPFFSSLYYTHKFDNNTSLLVGKIDAFELLRNAPFYGGATRHGFMNIAFSAPPSGVTPPSFIGGILNHTIGDTRITAMIYDPRDRYDDNLGFNDWFDDGVNFSLGATHSFKLFDRSSTFGMSGTYSTEEGVDYSSLGETAKYKYNIRAQATHNIYENNDDTIAVYLRAAAADGNPNIIDGTFVGGLGGNAFFFDRPQDQWGAGYYYYNLSNALQNSISDLPLGAELKDEQGFEIYYAFQATPWLTFTADAQYVTPAVSTQSKVALFGLRTNIVF